MTNREEENTGLLSGGLKRSWHNRATSQLYGCPMMDDGRVLRAGITCNNASS